MMVQNVGTWVLVVGFVLALIFALGGKAENELGVRVVWAYAGLAGALGVALALAVS